MATCKDCLHYEVCSTFESLVLRILLCGEKADKRCGLFKAKSEYVKAVRCGECTKWDAHEGDEYGTCANGEYISRNDYCSLGERKTDNEQV